MCYAIDVLLPNHFEKGPCHVFFDIHISNQSQFCNSVGSCRWLSRPALRGFAPSVLPPEALYDNLNNVKRRYATDFELCSQMPSAAQHINFISPPKRAKTPKMGTPESEIGMGREIQGFRRFSTDWEVLNEVGVDGVGVNFPFFFFFVICVSLSCLHFAGGF